MLPNMSLNIHKIYVMFTSFFTPYNMSYCCSSSRCGYLINIELVVQGRGTAQTRSSAVGIVPPES